MARFLAIDYGLKRVGIAVSDLAQIIASGLTTINQPELFDFLEKYCNDEDVECFVVGYPMSLDNTPTHLTPHVDKLIEQLQKKFPNKKVHKVDERFTSKMAMDTLIKSGVKKKKRRNKALLDEVSATIILQDFMKQLSE